MRLLTSRSGVRASLGALCRCKIFGDLTFNIIVQVCACTSLAGYALHRQQTNLSCSFKISPRNAQCAIFPYICTDLAVLRQKSCDINSMPEVNDLIAYLPAHLPPWPNGQGVGLLIRRLRVQVPQGVPIVSRTIERYFFARSSRNHNLDPSTGKQTNKQINKHACR